MKTTEIFIPRKRQFERKLKHLQKEGADNLDIVSDLKKEYARHFDMLVLNDSGMQGVNEVLGRILRS